MSKQFNTLLVGLLLVSFTSLTLASGPNGQHQRGQRMVKELNLSAEQQAEFKAIKQEQRAKAQSWRKSHFAETRGKVSQVLSDEQMVKFDAMKQQRAEKRAMRKSNKQY